MGPIVQHGQLGRIDCHDPSVTSSMCFEQRKVCGLCVRHACNDACAECTPVPGQSSHSHFYSARVHCF